MGCVSVVAGERPWAPRGEAIRAFCIDFNWGPGGPNGFAPPGLWADADPEQHLAWYAGLGANVIQTFAVSCNGYAWYQGGKVPPQPGLRHDFTTQLVRLGHARGMKVMGYFCVAANTRWGKEHPDLSYGTPATFHLPLTDAYLDYLAEAISDALRTTKMDGFMVDWLWNPSDEARQQANRRPVVEGGATTLHPAHRANRFPPTASPPRKTACSTSRKPPNAAGGASTTPPNGSSPTASSGCRATTCAARTS